MTDWQQALLGMMAGGQKAADAHATLMQSLAEREDLDPWTRALVSQAMTPSANAEETVIDDDTPDADDDALDDDDEDALEEDEIRRQRALRRLRRRFVDMQLELERLRARNDRFAAALGACRRCWGENRRCSACGGTGGPGAATPDRHLFRQIVDPAIRALRGDR